MTRIILLDTGPLSMAAHPRKNPKLGIWLQTHLRLQTATIAIPEIADYEVRRELLRANKTSSLSRLDALKIGLLYVPITTDVMLQAATFWAQMRQQGTPTATDTALDADVILAATAAILIGQGNSVIVATTNVKHLSRMVPAQPWDEIE
ncbi:MAG: nuclease [Oscillochloridaceae bacterium umkhey_bin13]